VLVIDNVETRRAQIERIDETVAGRDEEVSSPHRAIPTERNSALPP
jgi:hypothetical protein